MNSNKIIVEGSGYPPSDRSGTGFSKSTYLLGQQASDARLSLGVTCQKAGGWCGAQSYTASAASFSSTNGVEIPS